MTLKRLQAEYPNTWDHFSKWFDSNGSGAYGAGDLTQKGLDLWFPMYREYLRIENLDEYENQLETTI